MIDTATITTIFGSFATWESSMFAMFDNVNLWGITMLDIMLAFGFLDITIWGAMEIINSKKSDN